MFYKKKLLDICMDVNSVDMNFVDKRIVVRG